MKCGLNCYSNCMFDPKECLEKLYLHYRSVPIIYNHFWIWALDNATCANSRKHRFKKIIVVNKSFTSIVVAGMFGRSSWTTHMPIINAHASYVIYRCDCRQ